MPKFSAFIILITMAVSGVVNAQTDKAKVVKAEAPKISGGEKVAEVDEEEIKTVWGLTTYLGKKLVDEMGNRMNLDESEPEEKRVRKVKINLGPIKIERTETI